MARKSYNSRGLLNAKRAKAQLRAFSNNATSSGSYPQDMPRITGALLAAHVFGGGEHFSDDEWADYEGIGGGNLDSDYLVPGNEVQLEFDLFNQEEIEDDLRKIIARYEYALERMGTYALRWHWLQEDVEKFGQVEKMFKDMELARKLCGGGEPDPQEYFENL